MTASLAFYGVICLTSLRNRDAMRTFSKSESLAVKHSGPTPMPPWGAIPYLCAMR